jgi:EAL domain-containing protein (putative c-di-GMP-specific phosphodiesterase class I)
VWGTAQRDALTQEGCELGQGFLFSGSVDPHTAGRMLVTDGAPEETLTA